MKRLLLIPLVLVVGILFGQSENPCEDERYLAIKKKTLDEISEGEYDYFIKIDDECKNYKKNNYDTVVGNKSVFSTKGISITGGINYSTVVGNDANNDFDNLMGFRFGIENSLKNGPIIGITYSQRGFSISDNLDSEFKINYIAGYVLFRFSPENNFELLCGPELGYYFNGVAKGRECNNCPIETEYINGDEWVDGENSRLDYGITFGGRIATSKHMSIVSTYYMGLSDWGKDIEFQNRSFQISISFALK